MSPYFPDDLKGKSGAEIAQDLFDEAASEASSWLLERIDAKTLEWRDKRLGLTLRVSPGYLIGLQEVSSVADAAEFCSRNKIALFPEGALFLRGVAELPIACSRPPPQPTIAGFESSVVAFRTGRGVEVALGYPSFHFVRLVGGPLQESDPELPDPTSTTTLVIRNVDRAEVHHVAELALFNLRQSVPGAKFSFCRFGEVPRLEDPNAGRAITLGPEDLPDTTRPEALAFFNRADESEPIAGFLYFYRVVEACFDQVLGDLVHGWRADVNVNDLELLKLVRSLKDNEDKTGLRRVLGHIVDQPMLDSAAAQKVISAGTVDVLVSELYQRRNAIAHGRRGQHQEVLVPYAFSPGQDAQDRAWYDLMRTLALRAIRKFLLV